MNITQQQERRGDPPAPRDSGDGRGGAAALRLEKRTHLNTGNVRIILRNYGDGIAEIGWSFIPVAMSPKSGKGMSQERVENEDRAVRRARSRLRHLILSARLDHLLTLTYRDNVTESQATGVDVRSSSRATEAGSVALAPRSARPSRRGSPAVCLAASGRGWEHRRKSTAGERQATSLGIGPLSRQISRERFCRRNAKIERTSLPRILRDSGTPNIDHVAA